MACGCPVMGTQTGAIVELLTEGRGFLVPPEYTFTDVWGNSERSMIDIRKATDIIAVSITVAGWDTERATKYVESRTLDYPVTQVDKVIRELLDENK
jgi:glycosyltransferase involved in cell wall biosynthesis